MMNKNYTGLVLGSFVSALHLGWSILVAAGVAQPLMDWIFGLHFLNNPYKVMQFDLLTALTLVVVTFAVGYVAGVFFAFLWEKIHGKK